MHYPTQQHPDVTIQESFPTTMNHLNVGDLHLHKFVLGVGSENIGILCSSEKLAVSLTNRQALAGKELEPLQCNHLIVFHFSGVGGGLLFESCDDGQ